MHKATQAQAFSNQLEAWLKGKQPKTLANLISVFDEKSFAVVMLLLMLIPALPLPTGGITHVFEVVVALLALEQIAGRKSIWLPRALSRRVNLEKVMRGKVVRLLLKRVRWLEERSSPRGRWVFGLPLMNRFIGLAVLSLTIVAFLAPPFSGLDTLPSLGVVLICLAVILEDFIFLVVGGVVGALGVVLTIGLGSAIVTALHHLF